MDLNFVNKLSNKQLIGWTLFIITVLILLRLLKTEVKKNKESGFCAACLAAL